MSLKLCVLGSGSSGNSSLLLIDGRAILIDAGFGPRATPKRLAHTGLALDDISAILLTHADRDHFNPSWFGALLDRRIPVYFHQRHRAAIYHAIHTSAPGRSGHLLHAAGLLHEFADQPFTLHLPGADHAPQVRPIPLDHDRNGTCGFVIRNATARLGYATDLGRVTDALVHAMTDVDILAIESNYDRELQLTSGRPAMLQHRIMGGRGHLSNDESLAAVQRIVAASRRPPHHVVLLHLSRQCNHPALLEKLYKPHPHLAERLHLTTQHTPTAWLTLP